MGLKGIETYFAYRSFVPKQEGVSTSDINSRKEYSVATLKNMRQM